jgi:hypothetical protein
VDDERGNVFRLDQPVGMIGAPFGGMQRSLHRCRGCAGENAQHAYLTIDFRKKKIGMAVRSQNANFGHRHHKLAAPLAILRLLRDDFIGKIPREQKHVVRLVG